MEELDLNSKEIVDRLLDVYEAKNVKKLAEITGVSYNTLNGWIKNNNISLNFIYSTSKKFNVDFDWLLTGIEAQKTKSKEFENIYQKTTAALIMFSRYFDKFENKFVDLLAEEIYRKEEESQIDSFNSGGGVSPDFSQIIKILNQINNFNNTTPAAPANPNELKHLKLEYEDLKSKKKEEIVEWYQLERFARALNLEVKNFCDKKEEEVHNYIMCGSVSR